jgi:hypothetical protein
MNVGIVQAIPGLNLYNLYDLHRLIEVSLLGIVAGLILFSTPANDLTLRVCDRLPVFAKMLLFFLFGLGLISSLLHPTPEPFSLLGFSSVCHLAMLVLMIFYLGGLYLTYPQYTRRLLGILLLMSGGYYLLIDWVDSLRIQFFLLRTELPINPDEWIPLLRFPQFSNPRFLAQVLSAAIPISILPYLYRPSIFSLVIPIGLWELLWMNHSRALYLEVMAVGLLLPLIFKGSPSLKPYLKIQGACAAIGFLLYQVSQSLGVSLPSRSPQELMDSGRLLLWKSTVSLIQSHPWSGVGPLNFLDSIEKHLNVSHPHNALLWIAAEWGLPAGILLFTLVCWGFYRWMGSLSRTNHPELRIALSAALFCTGIHAQFSGNLLMPASQIIIALIVGTALGLFVSETPRIVVPVDIRPFIRSLGIKLLVISCMIGMLSGILPLLPHLTTQENEACREAFDEKHPNRCPVIPGYFAMQSAVE